MSSYGFVYILTNEYMPAVYKVGCTERSPHARAAELSNGSGVPSPFRVLCYVEVPDFQSVEKGAHEWLNGYRISPSREFFFRGIHQAVAFLWWHPRSLSFAEVGGDTPLLGRMFDPGGALEDTNYPWFDSLPNPWAPKAVVTEEADTPLVVVSQAASGGFVDA